MTDNQSNPADTADYTFDKGPFQGSKREQRLFNRAKYILDRLITELTEERRQLDHIDMNNQNDTVRELIGMPSPPAKLPDGTFAKPNYITAEDFTLTRIIMSLCILVMWRQTEEDIKITAGEWGFSPQLTQILINTANDMGFDLEKE